MYLQEAARLCQCHKGIPGMSCTPAHSAEMTGEIMFTVLGCTSEAAGRLVILGFSPYLMLSLLEPQLGIQHF